LILHLHELVAQTERSAHLLLALREGRLHLLETFSNVLHNAFDVLLVALESIIHLVHVQVELVINTDLAVLFGMLKLLILFYLLFFPLTLLVTRNNGHFSSKFIENYMRPLRKC
jgi:hypothetical protein